MKTRLLIAACGSALLLPLAGSPALAQAPVPGDSYQEAVPPPEPYETTNNKAIDRRLDRTEKALRELRAIVLKAQAQGVPVEVKPVGPDPVLTDLQQRFADLDASVRALTGQNESLRFELDQAKRQAAQAQADIRSLTERLDQAAQQPVSEAPVADGAAPAGEAEDYRLARAVVDSGDAAAGAAAMETFVQRYPGSSRVGTAYYWMGRSYAAKNDNRQAAAAFARSLKGWPQGSWAGDAVVQLAGALTAQKRTGEACAALGEFDSRYGAKASASVNSQAERIRKAAACG